jgi:predicted enzyme related to lactoylglutathione lyase
MAMAGVTGKGISYIMLGVADVDRAVAFYEGVLERPVQFKMDGFAFVDGGGVTIGLSRDLGKARTPMAGAFEIVFRVENVTASGKTIAAKGAKVIRELRPINGDDWGVTFEDPDGHYVTVMGPKGG